MDSIHVSQIYPCSRINYAAELYYVCELGKYLKYNYNQSLSIDGVILVDELKKSKVWEYFRIAVDEQWVCDTNIDDDNIKIDIINPLNVDIKIGNRLYTVDTLTIDEMDMKQRRDYPEYALRNPQKSQVSMVKQEDSAWVWGIYGKENRGFSMNNSSLNDDYLCYNLVSLIAYVAINRLKTHIPEKFVISVNSNVVMLTSALSYLLILNEHSNCLNGWCFYHIDESVTAKQRQQLGYYAWYMIGVDKGLLKEYYDAKTKINHLRELDIQEGDFVMLFERKELQKDNHIKKIDSCKLARINEIGNDIQLTYFNTTRPKYHQKYEFDDNTTIIKQMYSYNKPYEKIRTGEMTIDINDLGIGYLMYTERYFIVPLDESNDNIPVVVTNGVTVDKINLDQNNLVYWILKDYDYDFDEERFLRKYFPNEEPLYEAYMNGDDIDPSLFIQDV